MTMPRPNRSRYASFALAVALATSSVTGFAPSGTRIRATSRIGSQEGSGNDKTTPLFEEYQEEANDSKPPAIVDAKFGESVPLKRNASFGESVPLKRPSSELDSATPALFQQATTTVTNGNEPEEVVKAMRQRNLVVAIASVMVAVSSYVWQFTHPITPVQLLASMQSNSAPLTAIGTNGKPTVVDFWAPWCENCKMAAPTLQKLEAEYNGQVNFVLINGDRPEAFPLIERFGVDAIPHMALISAEGDVETALIGPIPKRVLEADLNVLLTNAENSNGDKKELPFKMLDAFARAPEFRRIQFQQADQ